MRRTCLRTGGSRVSQGNRFRLTGGLADDGFEVVGVEVGAFSAGFEAVLVLWGADEVHGHVPDDGHVLRSVSGAQPCEVVVEDDVEHPVKSVFDTPVGAHGEGENLGIELRGARCNAVSRATAPFRSTRLSTMAIMARWGKRGSSA